MTKVSKAIDRLASLFEFGHLQAASFPAKFLSEAADEIERLRARRPMVCESCKGRGWPKYVKWEDGTEVHGGPYDDCPDCGKDGAGPGVRWKS